MWLLILRCIATHTLPHVKGEAPTSTALAAVAFKGSFSKEARVHVRAATRAAKIAGRMPCKECVERG